MWLETEAGEYVDTLMVTKLVGTFGLGNRPGRSDFGHGYLWPYGRREMALPIWAHKRNVEYDRLVFQDCKENTLGWHESVSSQEPFYCRPVTPGEMSVDTVTCPTPRFNTDKGIALSEITPDRSSMCADLLALNMPKKSFYPPRNDVPIALSHDWSGVNQYDDLNELDAVSMATPLEDQVYRVSYKVPDVYANGNYVVWIEVNQEYDTNEHHDYDFFVDPALRDYGLAGLGQPSVVWKVPITVGGETISAQTKHYIGYGSPTGEDGVIRQPDNTISTNMPGSGGWRLLMLSNTDGDYRVRATYSPDEPCRAPNPVTNLHLIGADHHFVDLSFSPASGASMHEVRYKEGSNQIRDEDDFTRANPGPVMSGENAGKQIFRIDDLRGKTTYTVAVRSYDRCRLGSKLTAVDVETPQRIFTTVDACFIATAAYGTKEEPQVVELRAFRDRVLMKHDVGRSLVDLYYQLSPPVADVIREHDSLRFIVRTMLGPVVSAVRDIE